MRRSVSTRRILIGLALAGCVGLSGCNGEPESPEQHANEAVRSPAAGSSVAREDVEAALSAAEQYLNSGQLPKAEAILARLVEQAPEEPRARELMGQVLTVRARTMNPNADAALIAELRREAYEHYRVAAGLEPDSAGLQHSAGVMAMAAGEFAAALGSFDRAAELDPLRPQYPLFAAQVLIQLERYDEAERRLEAVLELDPDEPLAHASLAVVAMERRDFDDAVGHIAEARAIAPDDLRFRVQEARIHRRRGEPLQAVQMLAGLPDRLRTEEAVTAELAASYEALGHYLQAAEAWATRYRAQPTDPRAYIAAVRAGEAMLAADRWAEAEIWLDQARVAGGNAPEVQALAAAIAGSDPPPDGE
jgi:tetratricopeptide (TPR) repeat protein